MARDYNPKYGSPYGRVGKDDVSFDGKSWAYREPGETLDRPLGRKQAFIDEAGYNPHSQKLLNPLYDYSYGDVRDAAAALEIGNYNKEDEVDRTIEYLQNRFKPQDDAAEDSAPEPEYVTDPGTSFAEADSISDELASARAYAPLYQDAMRSGSLNPTSDDYQKNADDFLTAYTNRFMDISNRVRGTA